jgi:hypothetical protein
MADVRKPNTRATSDIAKSSATRKVKGSRVERHGKCRRIFLKNSLDLKSTSIRSVENYEKNIPIHNCNRRRCSSTYLGNIRTCVATRARVAFRLQRIRVVTGSKKTPFGGSWSSVDRRYGNVFVYGSPESGWRQKWLSGNLFQRRRAPGYG